MKNAEQTTNENISYAPDNQTQCEITESFDYNYVSVSARIAIYDDLLSSPRILEIQPNNTKDFIEDLASNIYKASHDMGGDIPYHAIKQMSENFIHAKFKEVVVSILDKGNTIRFTDQGPGISNKELAQQPGFSSATKEMKLYIDGVGSGLPIVSEYLNIKDGSLIIEDNLNGGSVITLSLKPSQEAQNQNSINNQYIHKSASYSNEPNHFIAQENYMHHNQIAQLSQPIPHQYQNTIQTQNGNYQNNMYHNLNQSVTPTNDMNPYFNAVQSIVSTLSERMLLILQLMLEINPIGVTDLRDHLDIPQSSASNELKKLEESGLVQKIGTKRQLTQYGFQVASSLKNHLF